MDISGKACMKHFNERHMWFAFAGCKRINAQTTTHKFWNRRQMQKSNEHATRSQLQITNVYKQIHKTSRNHFIFKGLQKACLITCQSIFLITMFVATYKLPCRNKFINISWVERSTISNHKGRKLNTRFQQLKFPLDCLEKGHTCYYKPVRNTFSRHDFFLSPPSQTNLQK